MSSSLESTFTPVAQLLNSGDIKTVFITAHVGPDGDTLGTMLAFRLALLQSVPSVKQVDCVISGKMPEVYSFLPGIETVQNYEVNPPSIDEYDLAISVDCGSVDRLGPAGETFENARHSLNMDHHISNDLFGKLNIVITDAAASGEVLMLFLESMSIPVTQDMATCMYTAIVTDTGGFKYSNTSPRVLAVSSRLVEAGADPERVFKIMFEEQPVSKMRMQAQAFLNTQYNDDATIGWTHVSNAMLKEFNSLDEHVDGLVESIRRVDTIKVAFVLKETKDGFTKVSCRSDDHRISVADVMQQFGGGGHKMAAGCTIEKPLSEAQALLLPRFQEALETIKTTA